MKLFIYELFSAGGLGANTPATLRAEGWAMLAALVADFDRVPNIQTLTLLEGSWRKPLRHYHTSIEEWDGAPEPCFLSDGSGEPSHETHPSTPYGTLGNFCRRIGPGEEPAAFQEMVARADMVLVIAPECGGLLAERSRWVLDAGKVLLGSDVAAINLTGDKYALAQHFARHGVPTPVTLLLGDHGVSNPSVLYPAVCKPRHGAGSQATFLIHNDLDLSRCWRRARAELPGDEFLLQAFVPGQAASVTFLLGPNQRLALQPAAQHLSADGRFHYLGGRLPLPQPLAKRAAALGSNAVATVAGLHGFVGVDLVLGEEEDGSRDQVIEINPRPTTSYICLRQLAEDNLAQALLRIVQGEQVAPLRWRSGPVHFSVKVD